MDTSALLDDLRSAAPVPPPPKGFEPGMKFTPGGALESLTIPFGGDLLSQDQYDDAARAQGVPLPADMTLQLIEVKFGGSDNKAAWHRRFEDTGKKHTAYTAPNSTSNWFYRFKVVPKSLWRGRDYEQLLAEVRKAVRSKGLPKVTNALATEVIILGDFQTGKTDHLGGTPELLERSECALQQVMKKLRRTKPAEIVLIDVGDSTEGFESAPNAAQGNDLDLTEQMTVWRRIFWRWISEVAKLGVPVQVLGVPSNHCRVRKGKNAQGKPSDDWGLQVIGTLADMAAVNPDTYGHVSFYIPETYDEHLALTLVGGKTIGAFHGHQKASPAALLGWLDGQASGRSPIGHADIVFAGHYHHLTVDTWGDNRWLFVSPTMDSGSSWYSNLTGRKSRTGVLTVTVDEHGWRDLFVAWT